jgi:hypothetical protein
MATNYFELVPQIVAEEKFFDVSVAGIIRAVGSEEYKAQFKYPHVTKRTDGTEAEVQLTVNFGGSVEAGWQVAVIMHGVRIDGIDFEESYTDQNGKEQSGWHRHVWCGVKLTSDRNKTPISGLDECVSLEVFIYFVSQVMNLKWNRIDNGEMLDFKK